MVANENGIYNRYIFTYSFYYIYITSLLQKNLLGEGSMWRLAMQKRDGDGREIRIEACESGWCLRNSLRKVSMSAISGIESLPVTSCDSSCLR